MKPTWMVVGCASNAGETGTGTAPITEGLGAVQKIFDGKARSALVNRASSLAPRKQLVVPGQPDKSFLVQKLRGQLSSEEGQPMPNGGVFSGHFDGRAVDHGRRPRRVSAPCVHGRRNG